jgi:hypothetical protein
MKRHGFKGLGAGHGVERKHRSPGSVGGCATPGRVFKGLRMAGRMGHARVTVLGLTIHAVDTERGFLLIKGAVPGPNGGLVLVRSATKRPAPGDYEAPAELEVRADSPADTETPAVAGDPVPSGAAGSAGETGFSGAAGPSSSEEVSA